MIDLAKLNEVLAGYKDHFNSHWNNEKFKWEAIKHFKDNWYFDAENFGEMFKVATEKTRNLLASGYNYPRGMILEFANANDSAVRQMFRDLFDETKDVGTRVSEFQAASEAMRVKYDDGTWRNHFQNTNAISTYLWLMYPDKYYIYKYELFRDVAKELNSDYAPKRDGSVESMLGGFGLYDEINKIICQDEQLAAMVRNAVDDNCYTDDKLITATIDFGFYLSRVFLNEKKAAKEAESWFPKDYSPNISVGQWIDLLQDASVFTYNSLQIMKRMKDYGGQATCTQLATRYGGSSNFYNSGSSSLARRVAEKTGCNVMTCDNDNAKWWPILYMGKAASSSDSGTYIWRLRDELSQAIDSVDFSNIPLYHSDQLTNGEHNFIMDKIREQNPVLPIDKVISEYTKADFLSKVFMKEERFDLLKALVENKMNVILQGPPGVGKTFAAKKLAYAMMGEVDDSRIEFVQFHQNYSYEDFVMGYRPDSEGFKLREGIFYRFCHKASNNPDKKYFFIIDEINRGNLSKIFGELMMLIEKDYRDEKVTLAYTDIPFSVPKNIYIIGMMNTADRSLAMIDYALRRRFGFFEMEPAFDSDGFAKYQKAFDNEVFDALIRKIVELNKQIGEDDSLGSGFKIGHSYFCGRKQDECTTDWMRSVVEFDIIPMLSEYWFDEPSKVKEWKGNFDKVFEDV